MPLNTTKTKNTVTGAFRKALIERALDAKRSHSLGYAYGATHPQASAADPRNGKCGKTVLSDGGPLRIEGPRGRAGFFEPVLILSPARLSGQATRRRPWRALHNSRDKSWGSRSNRATSAVRSQLRA